jgi:hypothetical protein
MEEMRQLISKRGEATPRSQHKGQKEAATAGTDAAQTEDLLRSIEDAVSEADKSLVRTASNQEALSVDIGLLVADLKEVGLVSISVASINVLTVCNRKLAFLNGLERNFKAQSANVNW